MLLIVWILSFLSISCDLVGNGDDSSATTQHAVSYPTQTVDTAYNSTTVVTFTDLTTFANYAAERFGAPGENLANWPEAVGFSVTYLMMGHPVTVTAHTYQLVNNVVFLSIAIGMSRIIPWALRSAILMKPLCQTPFPQALESV